MPFPFSISVWDSPASVYMCVHTCERQTADGQALLSLPFSLLVSCLCHHRSKAITRHNDSIISQNWPEEEHLKILRNSQALSKHLSVSEPNFWYKKHSWRWETKRDPASFPSDIGNRSPELLHEVEQNCLLQTRSPWSSENHQAFPSQPFCFSFP